MSSQTVVLAPAQPKTLTRKGFPLIATVDPRDGLEWTLLLSPSLIEKCRQRGLGMSKDLAFSVREGLQNRKCVKRVYHGVRDTGRTRGDDDYLCYAIRPPRRYFDDGTDQAVPATKILLVFVDEERVIFNFYWSDSCTDDTDQPVDHEERFINPIL